LLERNTGVLDLFVKIAAQPPRARVSSGEHFGATAHKQA
jgi:hypothetical protein